MKSSHLCFILIAVIFPWLPCQVVCAEDLLITGTIGGVKPYDSREGIVFDDAAIVSGANVSAESTFEVHLKPGTRVAAGARLSIRVKDNDGMSNRCEMYYFGHLDFNALDDQDKDLLKNFEECELGTNPNEYDMDNDDDGMEDWWEIKYFGLDLGQDRNDDYDGDGISNWIEYRLNSDPSQKNTYEPGVHYKYDDLGRIEQIQRIPGR